MYVSPGGLTNSISRRSETAIVRRGDQLPIFDDHLGLSPDEVGDGKNGIRLSSMGSSFEGRFCSQVIWKKLERKTVKNDPQLQVDVLEVRPPRFLRFL